MSKVLIKSHYFPPATKLDSGTDATPALPLVETAPDDESVLAGDGFSATSADTAPVTTHLPVVWDIRVVKSNVPDAPPDLDFRKDFALSSFSRVHDNKLREFASVGLCDSNQDWVTLFYEQRTNGGDLLPVLAPAFVEDYSTVIVTVIRARPCMKHVLLSALYPCPSPVKIQTWHLFSPSALIVSVYT